MKRINYLVFLLSIIFTSLLSHNTLASEIILKITNKNNTQIDVTEKIFNEYEQFEIATETPWTNGKPVFKGPLLSKILKDQGLYGKDIKAIAINNYTVEIPSVDYQNYDIILARYIDDIPLTLRTKGPLWIIYPWHEKKELRKKIYYTRSIWQLAKIEIIN